MKKLKLQVKFSGSNYFGWQVQNQAGPTVQGTLNTALEKVYKEKIKTIGSGRTDARVHSLDHHVVFTPPFSIPSDSLIKALNSHLPEDIRIYTCVEVENDFRATNDAIKKEYRYLFTNDPIGSPFQNDLMTNLTFDLNFDAMSRACEAFIGSYDFENFHCTGSDPANTIREIYECEIIKVDPDFHGILGPHYCLRVVGNGFLKQMVRLIVGTVWSHGRGKVSIEDIQKSLALEDAGHLAAVAPAQGLYKFKVHY